MSLRVLVLLIAALAPAAAVGQGDLIGQVQERLRALGFDPGPGKGEFDEKTQAALAQFQLSVPMPASGQLDELTLAHLGVRDYPASAGASAPADEAPAEPKSN